VPGFFLKRISMTPSQKHLAVGIVLLVFFGWVMWIGAPHLFT
jgi:hypothetical protein